MERKLIESGIGNVSWWGMSPSYLFPTNTGEKILLLAASDGRHFLDRLLQPSASTSFWILEPNLMAYARQILFIALIDQLPLKFSDDTSARLFLEIYGNVSLSEEAASALASTSEFLIEWLRDESNEVKTIGDTLIDLHLLKLREVDALEGIFKIWRGALKSTESFASKFFELRTKDLLQDRIETKDGVFDMDYQFRLSSRGGGLISLKEYRHWRTTGVAFEWVDGEVKPYDNLSLISSMATNSHQRQSHQKGYWGDIVTGPFISFGIDTKRKVPFEQLNFKRASQEQSLQKITSIVKAAKERTGKIALTFLPLSTEQSLMAKDEMTSFLKTHSDSFDRIFLSCSVAHWLTLSLAKLLNSKGHLFAETPCFLLHMDEGVQDAFRNHILISSEKCFLSTVQNEEDHSSIILMEMMKNNVTATALL